MLSALICLAVLSHSIADPTPAPAAPTAPAPAQPQPAAAQSPLADVVARAIKRKIEQAQGQQRATTTGIELPPVGGVAAAPAMAPIPSSLAPTPTAQPQVPTAVGAPDPSMLATGARMMMGDPTDGSPRYVRVIGAPAEPGTGAPATVAANPFAAPAHDPMEVGTQNAAAASMPGTHHNVLDVLVGVWDVSANFDAGPGQPPETASGRMTNSWQLEGRWLKQDYTGTMASLGRFTGLGYIGYDNVAGHYVSTWMDTLSTTMLSSKGSFDKDRSALTLSGQFAVPGGATFSQRQVITVAGPDRYTVAMYLTGPDGVEFKTGDLEYTRAVRAVTTAQPR